MMLQRSATWQAQARKVATEQTRFSSLVLRLTGLLKVGKQRRAAYYVACKTDRPPKVVLKIPTPIDNINDVLEVPHIRDELEARPSPFVKHNNWGYGFSDDNDRVVLNTMKFASASETSVGYCTDDDEVSSNAMSDTTMCVPLPPYAVRAGARKTIYFDPAKVNAAIVTTGGLCPGVNDVIKGIVYKLTDYGVPEGNILGIRYGFKGFLMPHMKPVVLTPRGVDNIHLRGGSILGTTGGDVDLTGIVNKLNMWQLDMLFVVGGVGANHKANQIHELCRKRKVKCCVIGVPKSIDNDILLIDRTFGYETAVEESQRALYAAKVEASSSYRGVGIVKLTGQESGFIALSASLASGVVDVCLIPEAPFTLDHPNGVLPYIEKLIDERGHAVICVSEGAGKELLCSQTNCQTREQDVSSISIDNATRRGDTPDISVFLKQKLQAYFQGDVTVRLIDPTYMIRAIPCNAKDHIYCKLLSQNAVDTAFAGYTGVTVGQVNNHSVALPIPVIVQSRKQVDPKGKSWNRLTAANQQPDFL